MSFLNGSGLMQFASLNRGGWTFEEYFTDDQTTLDARWSKTGTLTAPDATNDRMNWSGTRSGVQHTSSADPLGGIADNTAWLMRYLINVTNSTGGTYSSHFFLVLSSADHATSDQGSQDALGMSFRARNSDPRRIYQVKTDGASLETGVSLLTNAFSNSTDYYDQHTRLSSTSFKYERFSDSGFSTSIEAKTNTIASTIQSLRYIKFANYFVAPAGSDTFNGITKNIQFANGVTVAP